MSCALSVIVAHENPRVPLRRCLAALDRACNNVSAEIVVVQSADVPPEPLPSGSTSLTMIRVRGGALAPQLWARGLAVARGDCVAFTLANCEVSEEWAEPLIEALHDGLAGVAGPIICASNVGLLNRGLYYLRYSAYIPERVADVDVTGEIPGDNAAYRRQALVAHRDVVADGFWEVLFHRKLRADNARLGTRRAGHVRFNGGVTLVHSLRHRFAHGRHFGAWRVAEGIRRPWQVVAAAPLVPALLGGRAALHVLGTRSHRWPFVSATPALLLLAAAWSLGEAVGAACGGALPTAVVSDENDTRLAPSTRTGRSAVGG